MQEDQYVTEVMLMEDFLVNGSTLEQGIIQVYAMSQ